MAQTLHYLYIRSSERRDQNPNKESKMEKQTQFTKEIILISAAIEEEDATRRTELLSQLKKLQAEGKASKMEKLNAISAKNRNSQFLLEGKARKMEKLNSRLTDWSPARIKNEYQTIYKIHAKEGYNPQRAGYLKRLKAAFLVVEEAK